MNFVDKTLVRLATRGTVFDEPALASIAAAAYDAEAMLIKGPFHAMFDELRLAVLLPVPQELSGFWQSPGIVTSPSSAKDLSELLQDSLGEHEQKHISEGTKT
jgi:hypothetical protein